MPGDPGGLARVDDILGVQMYKTTFTASPLVFGAFPSLHSADAWMLAFFLVYVFGPRSIPFALTYVFWIWWATMYLGHHYVVDLVGGAAYAVVAFYIGSFFLPPVLPTEEPDLEGKHRGSHELGEAMDRQEKQTLFQVPEDEHDADTGSSSSRNGDGQNGDKAFDLGQDDEDNDEDEEAELAYGDAKPLSFSERGVDIVEMSSVLVVKRQTTLAGLEIEEAGRDLIHSGPLSPTNSDHSSGSESSTTTVSSWTQRRKNHRASARSSVVRQSWNGWQGYESWVEVLATVNSPRTSPKTSPKSSPAHSPRSSTTQLDETVV
ncbi:Aureobasidin resistance protein Aur1 [Mortierella alpina]|nr:Aureobasidin resistance protein Aur1 [Mortierella alpina]